MHVIKDDICGRSLTRQHSKVNGLLIPGRYIEQVTSPDILPPDFKYPYLYVPTHLCSQTLCSQLLFPITLMYPHIYIFWRYFPIFSVSFEGFHSVLSWCGFNWCRIHGKNMQSFYLLLLQSSRANYQFLVCYWASSCFLMCWRIPSIAKKSPPGRFTRWICSAWRGRRHMKKWNVKNKAFFCYQHDFAIYFLLCASLFFFHQWDD